MGVHVGVHVGVYVCVCVCVGVCVHELQQNSGHCLQSVNTCVLLVLSFSTSPLFPSSPPLSSIPLLLSCPLDIWSLAKEGCMPTVMSAHGKCMVE